MAKLAGARVAQRVAREGVELLGLDGLVDGDASAPLEGRVGALYRASVGSTISGGTAEIQQLVIARRGLGLVSSPLAGVRVVEYAQYVAGPLCGVVLGDLGAEVIKVEPPAGDGYRHVMPVAAGLGRYFIPLNRGKRSVVVDLKAEDGRKRSAALLEARTSLSTTPRPGPCVRARLGRRSHWKPPRSWSGVVTSFGDLGPSRRDARLRPCRAGSRRVAHGARVPWRHRARARRRDPNRRPHRRVPPRTRGARRARSRARTGEGELVDVSLLAAALAVQLQDSSGSRARPTAPRRASAIAPTSTARAAEIAGGIAMNPYYRCYETPDGFVAVACLNVAQRRAFLSLFGATTHDRRPDLVPEDQASSR